MKGLVARRARSVTTQKELGQAAFDIRSDFGTRMMVNMEQGHHSEERASVESGQLTKEDLAETISEQCTIWDSRPMYKLGNQCLLLSILI